MTAFQTQSWVESFSPREFELLQLISRGLSNREIADKLYLSIETVKWYNKQMFMKLGVKNRIQAVNKAVELDLLQSEHALQPQKKTPLAGNLPAQLTSYVGREKEIGEIEELLKHHRLVILTGAGGSGKTRLALQVGEELKDQYNDGVWWVELANIHDPTLVLGAIVKTLNLTERADATLEEVLKRYLSRRHLLLLIDNLEHLLECAPQIGDLLAAAPGLSVLGTSRERLHIYGEQEYPVHPLDLPDSIDGIAREELETVESIVLFIKRARTVDPVFSLDDKALQDLVRICLQLDGLPLAIELCAPMVKVFSLGVIAERIENSIDAIPVGPRGLPDRQRTLRGAIQWGYDLLKENEKQLFMRLAVFNGGGTLQAVEAICGYGISGNIGNILSELVNKNLVLAQERQDGEIHFGLLETIRQFGHDRLLACGEAEGQVERHSKYYMKLAEQGSVEICGPNQVVWTDRFITTYDNMRIALEWIIESGNTESAMQFVCNLYWFWLRHSDFIEAQRWLEWAIALSNAKQYQELYVEAFSDLTWLFYLQGKNEKAMKMAEQALLLARTQPNKHLVAQALLNLGLMLVSRNGDIDRGRAYIEEAKNICEKISDDWVLARALMHLAVVQSYKKEYSTARSLYAKSFNLYKKLGDLQFQGVIKRLIGELEINRNNLADGIEAHREALTIAQAVKSNLQIAYNIYSLAGVEKVKGSHLRAVQLYLASKKILRDLGVLWIEDDSEMKEALETAHAALGATEFKSAVDAGQHMTIEEAVEYALGDELETKKIKTDSKEPTS